MATWEGSFWFTSLVTLLSNLEMMGDFLFWKGGVKSLLYL